MTNGTHPNYRIVPYDSSWPEVFERERTVIAGALSLSPGRVEHIGSTAVSGLGAKPIVDVMIGVDGESQFRRCVALLSPLGYEHRGETVPGTLYNRKEGPPRVNAHLCQFEGDFWSEKVVFRDYLRSHTETAREYEALKQRILEELGPDPPAYNAAKAPFIREVLARAVFEQP